MSFIDKFLAVSALAGLALLAAQAPGIAAGGDGRPAAVSEPVGLTEWSALHLGLSRAPSRAEAPRAEAAAASYAFASDQDLDVVDAHWMALTMWGEARSDGEEGMRAVGHVIDNRRRSGRRSGPFVTDTVSEAWQFSCWNRGDPNDAAMLNVESLPPESRDYQLWQSARRLAADILAGRSDDPTGGALFYHTDAVAPAWSRGVAPVQRIGSHLFFRSAA
jgi:spore germination cell wall hydrolase CwlJ-like protein